MTSVWHFPHSAKKILILAAMISFALSTGCEKQMDNDPNKSIDKTRAKEIAQQAIDATTDQHQFVILDDKTMEKDYGWIFFYDTQKAIESGDFMDSVPGAGPLVVLRDDESTRFISTSMPTHLAIQAFEEQLRAEQGN